MQACSNGQHSLGFLCTYSAISGKFINHFIQRQRPEHVCVIIISAMQDPLVYHTFQNLTIWQIHAVFLKKMNLYSIAETGREVLVLQIQSSVYKTLEAQFVKFIFCSVTGYITLVSSQTQHRGWKCVWTCISSRSCVFLSVYVYRRFCDIRQPCFLV